MNRFKVLVSAVLVVTGLTSLGVTRVALAHSRSAAPARQSGSSHTITVSARGEARVAPDEATISLGVQSRASDAQGALSKNSDAMNAVISAVQGQGLARDHIQTSGLSIWYDSEHEVYIATHELTVRIDDVNKVGAVLDAAVAAGANNSWGVSFGLRDQAGAEAQALRAAVASARKHADGIAAALQVTITGVSSASEPSYSSPIPYGGGVASGAPVAAAPSTPVQPGQLSVTAQVTIVYTFS